MCVREMSGNFVFSLLYEPCIISSHVPHQNLHCLPSSSRVATVRENYLENEFFSRSGKSQGILWMAREI